MGQNGRWRRAMVDHIVADHPGLILDVATGPAGVALQLAERTGARVVGVDLTLDMLRQGRRSVAARGMADRVQLVAGRAEQTPFADATFDALTFTYLLRYVDDPETTLNRARPVGEARRGRRQPRVPRAAEPVLEVLVVGVHTPPPSPGGWLTGGRPWFDVGRFLGPNITDHYRRYPVDWTIDAWRNAGFVDVGVRRMSLGGGLVMWGRRAGG